jgi:hypothetical protein
MVGDRSTSLERRRWLPVHTGPTLTAGPPKAFPKRTAKVADRVVEPEATNTIMGRHEWSTMLKAM